MTTHHRSPHAALRDPLAAGHLALHLRTCWLPQDLPWERALRWPALAQGASVLDVWTEDLSHLPLPPWTDRVGRRSDAGGGDHTVVRVDDSDVGVQVDRSGVVRLSWVVPRATGDLPALLLTRRGPRAALDLVADAGLLTAR